MQSRDDPPPRLREPPLAALFAALFAALRAARPKHAAALGMHPAQRP